MLSTTFSLSHSAASPCRVTIETDVFNGLPGIQIVGLATKSVAEARERLRSALRNSDLEFPPRKITFNLAPADIAKHGTGYELAMAVGILSASGQIPLQPETICWAAELALDGSLKPARDIHATLLSAPNAGFKSIYLDPYTPLNDALCQGLVVYRPHTIRELYLHIIGEQVLTPWKNIGKLQMTLSSRKTTDFADIKGLLLAKRAAEIAAAGHHNLLLSGPPGVGKTLLAQALPSILPPLNTAEWRECLYLSSLSEKTNLDFSLDQQRPFRAPHHSASLVAIVGGGTLPKPGEVTLAHHGILFLDELPEFSRTILEALRQPLEERTVRIARSQSSADFPANIMLIASMNPCPCGFAGSLHHSCHCSPGSIARYQQRISGPLLDRIDLHCKITDIETSGFFETAITAESSSQIRARVIRARQHQTRRFSQLDFHSNQLIPAKQLLTLSKPSAAARDFLQRSLDQHSVSPRGASRALKVARTIADLADADLVEIEHIAEALQFKQHSTPDTTSLA